MQKKPVVEIYPQSRFLSLNLIEIWRYRDLLFLLVHRDIVATYKQTVLGPLWLVIQPIFTSLVMTVVFSRVAGLSTDGIPALLFYLSGNIAWSYFSTCLRSTSETFRVNASVFGKVYFPRLISPLSIVISSLMKFFMQFCLFVMVYLYYHNLGQVVFSFSNILLLPFIIALLGLTGFGFGIFISSMTTKYRDFSYLVEFGVQLLMYFTPVILPLSVFYEKLGAFSYLIKFNPMTGIIESFRQILLGGSQVPWNLLAYSAGSAVVIVFWGVILFNRTEKNFMDTV